MSLSQEEARQKIEEQGLSFNNETFFKLIKADDAEHISLFLKAGQSPYVKDRDGYTPLMNAVLYKKYDAIDALLNANIRVNNSNRYGKTPLMLAVINEDEHAANQLIEYGADLNITDANGNTPLIMSAMNNNPNLASILLDAGADPSIENDNQTTARDVARKKGYKTITNLLDKKKTADGEQESSSAKPSDLIKSEKGNALFKAINSNDVDKVKSLLEEGANPQQVNSFGSPPLSHAASLGHNDIVEVLLDYVVDINQKDRRGHTALMTSVISGNLPLVTTLIDAGVDINAQSETGSTALLHSVLEENEKIVAYLLEHGADPNIKNYDGYSPLLLAIMKHNKEIVRLLIDAGADIHDSVHDKSTFTRADGDILDLLNKADAESGD